MVKSYRTVFCSRCGLSAPRGGTADITKWNWRSSASGTVPMPSTSMRCRPCPCCGQLRLDPYTIQHEGLTLKMCPFCGGRPHISFSANKSYLRFRIECTECHAGGQYCDADFEPNPEPILKLAELWNRRTSDSEEVSE